MKLQLNMQSKIMTFWVTSILITGTLLLSQCNSDNDEPGISIDVNLEEAKFTDFPLTEVDYVAIDIDHPEILDGAESKHGTIVITLPHSHNSMALSLESETFDHSKFNVFPEVGALMIFSQSVPTTYEIRSRVETTMLVHYDVTVVIESAPVEEELEITSFRFEKSKNPALTSDIDAVRIAYHENTSVSPIMILVPVGTDFSDLVPTISYTGANIDYSVNFDPLLAYPEEGLSLDFKYPNIIQIVLSESNGSRSKTYNVFVDVPNPIRFEQAEIFAPDVPKETTQYHSGIARWFNQGNYPIGGLGATSYTDLATPIEEWEYNIFTVNLSKDGSGKVEPGQEGLVNLTISNRAIPDILGTYKATADFAFALNPELSLDQMSNGCH